MQIDDAQRLVRRALTLFDLGDDAEITFVKYRENHVFRVDTRAGDVFAVRLHRPGYRDDIEIHSELNYLDALAAHGVRVPRVLRARDGALVHRVAVGPDERLVSIQHWVPDAAPFGDVDGALSGRHDPAPAAFAAIGATLGEMHAAGERIGTPADFRRSAWDADGLVGTSALWGDARTLASLGADERAAIDAAVTLLHARLSALPTDPSIYGVVHADATPENVLESPSGVVLIDFDDFGTGWYVFDLVTAVFHHARNPRYPLFERALREGYGHTRPLTEPELSAWDDLMLARGLTYLGWAAERPGDPASEFVSAVVAPWVAEAAASLVSGRPAPWRTHPAQTPTLESR